MISHHLLQLLLLTDWTKREANPTETFHVFFFALRSFLWSNAQKNMKRNIWRWRESAALTFVVSVPLLVVSPSSPTFLSHQFIFPSCCFFDQSGSIFVSQNATGKSLSRLQTCGWRRRVVVTFLNIWRLHEDDVVGVKFKGRSNYISAPPLTSALHFLISQPFYELWRVFVPRGSGSVLTRCSSAGDCADFLNVESLMRE